MPHHSVCSIFFSDAFSFVYYRHVIWAPLEVTMRTFPVLSDTYAQARSSGTPAAWAKVHLLVSVMSQAIEGAAQMLLDVI